MPILYFVSVWIHVLAAAVWIGSMVFFALVVLPALRGAGLAALAPGALKELGVRYRRLGWTSLLVLITTGVTNLMLRGLGWRDLGNAVFWRTEFGRVLGYKLFFVALVLLATAGHDAFMGRRATKRLADEPTSDNAARIRRRASLLGRATLLLSLAVLFFAVALVRGLP